MRRLYDTKNNENLETVRLWQGEKWQCDRETKCTKLELKMAENDIRIMEKN